MSLFGRAGKSLRDAGRFISTTGAGALRKVGQSAADIRKFAGDVNTATGGLAGVAWEAGKSVPGLSTIETNIERGLGLAEKGSKVGLAAIDIGKRAGGVRNVADATAVFGDAKGFYKANVPQSVQGKVSRKFKKKP